MQDVKTRAADVTPVERACLQLVKRHGWSLTEVGRMFGFSPEVISRKVQSAVEKGETVQQAA